MKLLSYLLMCRPQVQPISVHSQRVIKKKKKRKTHSQSSVLELPLTCVAHLCLCVLATEWRQEPCQAPLPPSRTLSLSLSSRFFRSEREWSRAIAEHCNVSVSLALLPSFTPAAYPLLICTASLKHTSHFPSPPIASTSQWKSV